jgi:uncharacterized protein (DUF2345 family)
MADSNYTLTASNDIKVVASSDIDMTATAGHFKVAVADSNVVLNLDDVEKTAYLYANKDIDFTAFNDIKQFAQSNVYVTASDGSMTLSANYNNVQVVMADSNYTLTASNDIKVVASSDIDMTAMNGNFYVAAAESNVTLKLDNLNRSAYVYAQNEVKLTASNEMVQWAKNNVKVTASEGSMTLAANYNTAVINMANSNITASASNDFALNAKNNVTLTAETQSFLASAAADDVRIKLDHIDQSANVYAKGAIHINTSNSMYTKTTGDYRLTACNAIYTTAQNSIDMRAMGESFRISATNDQSYAMFSGDIAINTVGSFRTTATSNVELTATTGDYIMAATGADSFIKMTAETDTVSLKAGANIQSTASNMYTVYGKNKVRMEVDATKAYMDLDVLAQSAKVYGALDAILESGQTVNLKSGDSTTVEAATDLHIKTNGNTQTIDMTAGVFSANVTNNYNLKVNGIERFSVNANRVKIDGDLEITGVLNTVNMTNTTLSVEDKYIHLSTNSDGTITNDEAISQSGIFVDGLPTMASSNVDLNKECYQKSFMWNNGKKANGGILALGSTAVQDIDQESYWEVKGGSFRITTPVNVQRDGNNDVTAAFDIVSYAFRVSDIGSLQIVKMLTKAGDAPNTVPEITVMTEIGGLGGVVREPRVITA